MACFLIEGEPQQFPMWLLAIERFGLGTSIIVFVLAVIWKLLPAVIRFLGAWKKQVEETAKVAPCIAEFAKAMTRAAPSVLEGVRDLAENAERIADHVVGEDRSEHRRRGSRVRRTGDSAHPATANAEE